MADESGAENVYVLLKLLTPICSLMAMMARSMATDAIDEIGDGRRCCHPIAEAATRLAGKPAWAALKMMCA